MWSGSISFGLVNVPVKLYNAVSRKAVSFNQLDARTGSRIRHRKVSAESGEEVPADQIVKGYDLGGGRYVTVSEDELAALDPHAQRTIDIDEFVDLADIDPLFYDSGYHLAPDGPSPKAYALLARAMEESGKVGVARFVMRSKQYLAAVRAVDGRLVLSTMVHADELVDPASITEVAAADQAEVSTKELAMARQLIESLSAPFEPERFTDTHREAVLALIEAKAAGEEVLVPEREDTADKVVDLMAALEASVAAAKEARGRHPTARPEPAAEPGTPHAPAPVEDEAALASG